jgi:hypothetical protein
MDSMSTSFDINICSDFGVKEASESLLSFLKHCCLGPDKDEVLLGSLFLGYYLEMPHNRAGFCSERTDFVLLVISQLKSVKSNQVQYQFLFSVWLLTFDAKNCSALLQVPDLVPNLIEVAKLAVKEKVVRLVVSCFINLLKNSKILAIPQFVGAKVASFVETLLNRTYSDQEFLDDISNLSKELNFEIQKLRY